MVGAAQKPSGPPEKLLTLGTKVAMMTCAATFSLPGHLPVWSQHPHCCSFDRSARAHLGSASPPAALTGTPRSADRNCALKLLSKAAKKGHSRVSLARLCCL